MWARVRFDIGWRDLGYGMLKCAWPGERSVLERRLESFWRDDDQVLACFSVRSGFDLFLQALALPPNSEIMFTALNVKGMIKIARRHELIPVPVDLDLDTMAPSLEAMERAITPATRAIVVAHLFGTRVDLTPLVEIAKHHNILVIEDCAQAFHGPAFMGHPDADVCMFSFGPLKTISALGAALLRIKDPTLFDGMKRLQASYPVQSHRAYFKRLAKFGALKLLLSRTMFGLVFRLFKLRGGDYDDAISDSVRGVAALGTSQKMRRQPCTALLAVLDRRLRAWNENYLGARTSAGESMRALVGDTVVCPGGKSPNHSYWVFPILADDSRSMIKALRNAGFDGANLPRSEAVAAPPDRPELEPVIAKDVLERIVILPCYPVMARTQLEREAAVVAQVAAGSDAHGDERTIPAERLT